MTILDLRLAVAPTIDGLFDDDRLDGSYVCPLCYYRINCGLTDGQMLYVSIYNGIDMKTETTQHGRYSIHPGEPHVSEIMQRESMGDYPHGPMRSMLRKLSVIQEDTESAPYLQKTIRPTGLAYGGRLDSSDSGNNGADAETSHANAGTGPVDGRTLVLGKLVCCM